MVSIEISPILEWAWYILDWAVTWVWIFCILVATWILWKGAIDSATDLMKKAKTGRGKKISRMKE